MTKKFSPTKILIGLNTGLTTLALSATSVFADITNPVVGDLGNDTEAAESGSLFLSFFVRMWRVAVTAGALMLLTYFVWGAIDWIAAGGESGKLEKARQKMTQSALGMIILVSSFTIIAFISQLLFGSEFSLLKLTFPSGNAAIINNGTNPGGGAGGGGTLPGDPIPN